MAKLEILKAAVYCDTYGKYNAGSIDGAWMQLAKYQTNEEFLEACARLHKDEHDPEFMFQDMEYLPDEFYSESWIDPEVFLVLATVKPWDEEKQSAFAAFIDEKGWPPDMFSIEEFLAAQKSGKRAKKRPNKTWLDDETEEARSILKSAGSWLADSLYKAMKWRDGIFMEFDKPEIEKRFCFGYSLQGRTYEEAQELCNSFSEDDFRRENLANFDRDYIRVIKVLDENKKVSIAPKYYDEKIFYYIAEPDTLPLNDSIELTEEETTELKEKYMKAMNMLRSNFEKQLNSYLKKYGLTKIHKWTYDADD